MSSTLHTTLLIGALVLFILAGLGIPEAPKFKYAGWGLALATAAFLPW